eukprot:TRINITY_DN80189_c0_g1_i1.p1 TRINITY_DN80189_c0_g1~~TRINITY_DN80189_c0_g1_i1.p1  ORF type:complete len:345 (-),score=27.52 TRINITY_DN80189_c0_g1_i1:101-1135(-)
MACRDCQLSPAIYFCRKCQHELCEPCGNKHVARSPFPETHLGYLQPAAQRNTDAPRYSVRGHAGSELRDIPEFDSRPSQFLDRFADRTRRSVGIVQEPQRKMSWHDRDDRVQVLIVGDSLIQDFSTRTYTRRHIIYLRKLRCVITGVANATVGAVLHRLRQGLMASCPAPPLHTVVLCVGSDDCEAYSLQEIFRKTFETIEYIRSQCPSVRVLLLGLPPRLNSAEIADDDLRRKLLELNRVYQLIPSTVFVDLWPHFVTPNGERDGSLYENFQLLNARGYDKFSRLLVHALGFPEEPISTPPPERRQPDNRRRHRDRGRTRGRGSSDPNDLWDDPDDFLEGKGH